MRSIVDENWASDTERADSHVDLSFDCVLILNHKGNVIRVVRVDPGAIVPSI